MHRRYDRINLPIEIVRTLVAIAETGSFSKAGSKLHLSQPAISAQIKRLQTMIGGHVFDRVAGGVTLTPLGKLVLAHARRLLEANDQILLLGGTADNTPPLRIGLTTFYVNEFFSVAGNSPSISRINIYCGHSIEVAQNLADGYVDIACLLNAPSELGTLASEWQEDFVWVRDRHFVLSPGAPIPLVCWPGRPADQLTMHALESAGLNYRIAFTSADHHARSAAVSAGIGIMALPERFVSAPLVVAREHYLPQLTPASASVRVRPGVPISKAEPLTQMLWQLAPGKAKVAVLDA